MKNGVFVFCGSILALVACDETPSNSGGNFENAYAFDTYLEGSSSFVQLTLEALPSSTTDSDDLPTGGSATYDGVVFVGLDDGSDDGVFGTVRLTAAFANNRLNGSAGSFVNDDDEAVDGSLSISNGNFLPTGPAIGTAEVNGIVEFEAGKMNVDGTASHGFAGDDGEYHIGAFADGDGTAQPSIGGPIPVELSWVAKRQ